MRRITLTASLVLAVLVPAATAKPVTRHHAQQYQRAYRAVAHKFGQRTPGRNIVRYGLAHRAATDRDVTRSLAVLQRMLAPPVLHRTVYAPPASSSTSTVSTTPASSSGGLPACASESGTNYSTGPSNTNASSGATGRYQITPGTAANYGCSLATPAGQDACAQTIYAHQGAGAWVGCGG